MDFTVSVQAAGALVLNLQTIAGDNAINIAEKATGFSIDGDTGTESGVAVSVLIGTETLSATSADVAGTARWSVSVPAAAPYITGASLAVEVNAAKTGYSSPAATTRALTVDLVAPTAPGYTAPASLQVGAAISPMSPSGGSDIGEYSTADLPSGLSIDDTSGEISGTPDTANASTASATVTVSDAAGNTDTVSITFPAVDKGDQTLSGFQYGPASVTFGSGTVPGLTPPSGAENDLSYSATPANVCDVDSASGALTLLGAGGCVITATAAASDDYNEASVSFTVTVQPAGGLVLNLDAIATDNIVNIAEKAAGFTIDGDTGTESGVAVSLQIGTEVLTATSADVAGTARWSVSVPAAAPYITGASLAVEVNAAKTGYSSPAATTRALTVDLVAPTAATYTVPASLKVGEAITLMTPTGGVDIDQYAATNLPPGLDMNTNSGEISGTPDTANASTADAQVTVSDASGNTDTVSITFPEVDKGDQTLSGFQYGPASVTFGSGTVPGLTPPSGAENDLSYSATPANVCDVDSASGALTLLGAGGCVITATAAASDDYNEASVSFTVTVQPAGGLVLNLDAIATDNIVNIAEKAAGFTIDGDTGTESGVAVSLQIGTEVLTATSADVAGTARWAVSVPPNASYVTGASLEVTVNATKTGFTSPAANTRTLTLDLTAPSAPSYSAPRSLQVGALISPMNPGGGSGISGYSVTGLPPGLGINANSGVISGTPNTADASTSSATVIVSDAAGNTATVTITFPIVDKGEQTLSGFEYSASSVIFGSTTVPTPTAPTGAQTPLSYAATPAEVCTVDASTGALTLVGAGICEITATAAGSDDYNEASASFSVTVQSSGVLVLNLDAIAGDNTVNIAEKAAGFLISGDTGAEGAVDVTVTLGETELTAISADANPATWSVSVPENAAYISGTGEVVEVTASKTGYTTPVAVRRSLTLDLTAPSAPSYSAPRSLQVGALISPMNPSGGSGISGYSVTGLPPGLGINANSGVISGMPNTADASTSSATVTVSDAAGNTAEVSVTFPAVDKGDQSLSGFGYAASSVKFGTAAPSLILPAGARTALSYAATPAKVCSVHLSTGALTLLNTGDCEITVTAAASANYNSASATYTVTVREAETALTMTLTLDTTAVDEQGAASVIVTGTIFEPRDEPTSFTLSVGAPGDSATEGGDYAVVGDLILTIPSGETSATASFTLTAIDDSIDESDEALSITGASHVAGFEVIGASLSITDDDERGVRIDPNSLSLPEGGDASYAVVLTSQPTGEVTVTPSLASGDADVTLGEALIFDATNWDQAQTVTVSAAQDADATDDTATIRHTISGADYGDNEVTTDDVSVTVEDDETAITLTLDPSSVDENFGDASVTVTGTLDGLTRDAATTLNVRVGASDDAAIRGSDYDAVEVLSLTIPSGEASGSATFTFTVVDDSLDERVEAVSIIGTIEDAGFEVIGTTLSIADNDERGVQFSPGALRVPEGGDATYSVVLTAPPSGEVTVTPSLTSEDTDLTLSGALTFSESTWDQAQTVTVSAAQDMDDAGDDTATIRHAVSGADYGANGVTADDVSVTVDDDETALTLTVNPTTFDEQQGGAVVTVTGTLDGAPRDVPTAFTVKLGADGDAATKDADYALVSDLILTIPFVDSVAGSDQILTIPSGESSASVSYRFVIVEDSIDEPDEAMSITALSRTTDFEVIGTTLSIIDNDERGVRISPSSLTLAEGGEEGYAVVLTSQPTGEVTVTPSLGSGDADVSVGEALIFTETTWNEAQTVTVSAARDGDAMNDTATIRHAVSGADYGAGGVTVEDVTVTVEDLDTAVTLTVNPEAVDERDGATSLAVTATLGGGVTRDAPTSLTLSVGSADNSATEGDDYAAVNDLILTIPAGEASAEENFTLTIIDDFIDEPDEALSITGTSQDAGLEVIGTTLSIRDDDERGVGVSPGVMTLPEGASATYTLVLESEPTQSVTLTPTLSGSRDLTFEPSSLTFTPDDWDTPRTMTVTATEDDDAHHDSSIISHAAEGAEYSSLVDGELSLTISDNELASEGELPAQVTDLGATASATHVDLSWLAVQDEVLGYRVEASYDGGANWAEVEDNTGSTDPVYRHEVGLHFAETRRYRVSAVGETGAGLPSVYLRASATARLRGLTLSTTTRTETTTGMPGIDLCWIPQGRAGERTR